MIRDYEQWLKKELRQGLRELGIEEPEVDLDHPALLEHGDISTNAALKYSRVLGVSPLDLAQSLAAKWNDRRPEMIERVEAVKPGFINFYFTGSYLQAMIGEIIDQEEDFGQGHLADGQKIMIEHSQPNPFKEFHIGHLVNNIIGEAMVRLTNAQGADVRCVTYHGDVGLHVAKAIWAIVKYDLPCSTVEEIGSAYARGAEAFKADQEAAVEIKEYNRLIYQGGDERVDEIYRHGRQLSIAKFEEMFSRLGSRFDEHFFESLSAPIGLQKVRENIGPVFVESEGAVIYPEERSGLHTRVFINSQGLPTYEAKDLGLLELKRQYWDFDRSITVVDNEQFEYFKVVNRAAEMIWPELKDKLLNIPHGRLRLSTGRMSSREGNVLSGEAVLDEVKEMVLRRVETGGRVGENKDRVADQVTIGAIKYTVLKQSVGKNIIFDPEQSLSLEGDSGPYLQYTYTRALSILHKARQEQLPIEPSGPRPEKEPLERWLYRFPEITAQAFTESAPHQVITYLTATASLFNSFYAQEKIVDKDNVYSAYKLALTQATAVVLKNGLALLGIEAPTEM